MFIIHIFLKKFRVLIFLYGKYYIVHEILSHQVLLAKLCKEPKFDAKLLMMELK